MASVSPIYLSHIVTQKLPHIQTAAAILTTIIAMVLHPEYRKRAQEEIDRVIGSARLPDYADRGKLPYVEAFYREVMRWQPPTPLRM